MTESYEETLRQLLIHLANDQHLTLPVDGSLSLPDHSEPPPSPSPEPPDNDEYEAMRERVIVIKEMLCSDVKGKGKEPQSTLEQELLQMVLRLTAGPACQAQLTDQAATISRLLKQQEYLVRRMKEDRAVWESENQSMHRVAEALLRQVSTSRSYVHDDFRRYPAPYESEAMSLRRKVGDYHSRVQALETELQQLRPLLLMTPEALASARGIILPPSHLRNSMKKARDRDAASIDNCQNDASIEPSQEKASGLMPKRGGGGSKTAKISKKEQEAYFKSAPISADARTEHLLLASRRLGRERASILGEAMYRLVDSSGSSVNAALALNTNGKGIGPGPYAIPLIMQAPAPSSNTPPVNTKGKKKASASSTPGPVEWMAGMQAWSQGMWGAPVPPGIHPALPHPQLAYGSPGVTQKGAMADPPKGIRKKVTFSPPRKPGRKFIMHPSSGQQAPESRDVHVDPDIESSINPELIDNDIDNETSIPTHDETPLRPHNVLPGPIAGATTPSAGRSVPSLPNMHAHFQPAYVPHPGWPYYPYVFGQPFPFQSPPPLNLNTSPSNTVNTNMMPPPPPSTSVPKPAPVMTATKERPIPQSDGTMQSQTGRRVVRPRPKNAQARRKPPLLPTAVGQGTPLKEMRRETTPTPMESLLSAAQSIFSPEAEDVASSPPAKRRRRSLRTEDADDLSGSVAESISTAFGDGNAPKDKNPGSSRRTNGLDVLADQAIGSGANSRSRDGSPVASLTEFGGNGGDESVETGPVRRTLRKRNRNITNIVPIRPARKITRSESQAEAEIASTAPGPATAKESAQASSSVRVTRSRAGQQQSKAPPVVNAEVNTATKSNLRGKGKERADKKGKEPEKVTPQTHTRQLRAVSGRSRKEEEIPAQEAEDAGTTDAPAGGDADTGIGEIAVDVEPAVPHNEESSSDNIQIPMLSDFSSSDNEAEEAQAVDHSLSLLLSEEIRPADDQSSNLLHAALTQPQPQSPQLSPRPAFSFRLRPVNFGIEDGVDADEDYGDEDEDEDEDDDSVAIRLDGGGSTSGKREATFVGINGDRMRMPGQDGLSESVGRVLRDRPRRTSSSIRSPPRKVVPNKGQDRHTATLDLPPITAITTVRAAEVDSESNSELEPLAEPEPGEDEFGKRWREILDRKDRKK